MILAEVFERFVRKAPVTVMVRAMMAVALQPQELNDLFNRMAEGQYTRSLLFSSAVDLMGMVVSKSRPSINAAFQDVRETLPVSITSAYNKLNGLEPQITRALVRHSANRLEAVVRNVQGELEPLVPGYRTRIIDGYHFASTQRRLKVLRSCKAGPLPGHALVVLDPALMLATDMIPCEDGHAQEANKPRS